ncbi:ATP-binding protein [Sulfitobacter sp. JB4-11]|uniref:ATP-binding protein n=1 Tax=Sulfitobacter rhodophyticola TaxID=3238304 RepID=UPI003D81B102
MTRWADAVPEHQDSTPCPMCCPQPMLEPVELRVIDSEEGVRDALARLLAALGPLGLGIEERGLVELVLAEALNNIIEHAYPAEGPVGTIRVLLRLCCRGLHVRIIDDGVPMPGGRVPPGLPQDVSVGVAGLPEGGFGWFLIRDLAKDVAYRRLAGRNQLDLRLAVALPRNH